MSILKKLSYFLLGVLVFFSVASWYLFPHYKFIYECPGAYIYQKPLEWPFLHGLVELTSSHYAVKCNNQREQDFADKVGALDSQVFSVYMQYGPGLDWFSTEPYFYYYSDYLWKLDETLNFGWFFWVFADAPNTKKLMYYGQSTGIEFPDYVSTLNTGENMVIQNGRELYVVHQPEPEFYFEYSLSNLEKYKKTLSLNSTDFVYLKDWKKILFLEEEPIVVLNDKNLKNSNQPVTYTLSLKVYDLLTKSIEPYQEEQKISSQEILYPFVSDWLSHPNLLTRNPENMPQYLYKIYWGKKVSVLQIEEKKQTVQFKK